MILLIEIGIGVIAFERRDLLDVAVEQSLYETLHSIKHDETLIAPWIKLQDEVSSLYNHPIIINSELIFRLKFNMKNKSFSITSLNAVASTVQMIGSLCLIPCQCHVVQQQIVPTAPLSMPLNTDAKNQLSIASRIV